MMSQEHQGTNSVTPEVLSGKRKRGRPRKDDSLDISGTQGSDVAKRNRRRRIDSADCTDTALVGQVVSGVLDGSFDAGYLLTVRVGETGTVLRGVVFEPGLSIPILAANDVAPHVKMIERNEVTVPVSPITPVPSVAVDQNPSKLLHVNESAHPSEGSPSNWVPKVPSYDGSGPSSGPLNGPSDIAHVAPLEMQSESKTDPKVVEISGCIQASQSQAEKGKFVELLPVDDSSLPTKGAYCDINEPPEATLHIPEAKVNACNESASSDPKVDVESCPVLPSCNQEASTKSVDAVEMSQENESSAQVEGPSIVEPVAKDAELELASIPSPVKLHDVGAAIGTVDVVNQDNGAMLVDKSTNDVGEVPADTSLGGPLEVSDDTPHSATGSSSHDDASVRNGNLILDQKEILVEDVDMMETDLTVTAPAETSQFSVAAPVETLQLNVTPPAEMLHSHVISGVQDLQSDVTLTLEMLDAAPSTVKFPQDEVLHLIEKPIFTEASEEANKDLESEEVVDEIGLVGGLGIEVTPRAADDMPNEPQLKEPALLDLMGPAFSSQTPNCEDPEADGGGFMELPKVADQNIDIRVGEIPDDPSKTGELPQND